MSGGVLLHPPGDYRSGEEGTTTLEVPATTGGVSCYSVKFLIPCSYMAGLPEGWSPFLFGGQEPLEGGGSKLMWTAQEQWWGGRHGHSSRKNKKNSQPPPMAKGRGAGMVVLYIAIIVFMSRALHLLCMHHTTSCMPLLVIIMAYIRHCCSFVYRFVLVYSTL